MGLVPADATAAFFGKEEDGWGCLAASPGRDLTERVGPPLRDHSPLSYLFPALPQGAF